MNLTLPQRVVDAVLALPSLPPGDPRTRNGEYLDWCGLQDCFGCTALADLAGGEEARQAYLYRTRSAVKRVEVHHIEPDGLARKCFDEWTLPLCTDCHFGELHGQGMRGFLRRRGLWQEHGGNAYRAAARIYIAAFLMEGSASPESLASAARSFRLLDAELQP